MRKLTFDDVLIAPQFSHLRSRKDVDTSTHLGHWKLNLPIISANMDTVTGPTMATAMYKAGGIGCLHRFDTVEQNVRDYLQVGYSGARCIVSVGLGDSELVRAKALYEEGAMMFCLDVAHGAQIAVVEQYAKLKSLLEHAYIIVGNFANVNSTYRFALELGAWPDAIKVGVGPGSACTTRIKTGVGVPQLSAVLSHASCPTQIIADGGCRSAGDVVKALAAGAHAVMLGGMVAGTTETPGEVVDGVKKYRGSASKESYDVQGKDQAYITAEGESFTVPFKGSVLNVLADIEGGLRSAMTYVGAANLKDFRQKAELIEVSSATQQENGAHGKR
jgi:IMP dehydrogenase